ncbi:MAG TPA: DNA polymerase I [Gemmatimonadales bacterium]|nr:DNA polymerase I [Gemmatimonadales bacterium]
MASPTFPAKTVFLVDGYALIYRAFYAMIARPLTTSRGENTSAAWGITNFLMRILVEYRPDYLAWVHDRGVSFRQARYPDYKATREKLDEQLQQDFDRSLERIGQLLDAFGIPVVAVEGYEADDVIGTMATAARARGLEVVIISGDKDFYQLVEPGIRLLNPGRGGSAGIEEHWVDEHNASDRFGVPPERVVDFLALVGDNSDNVPGVKGVGEKTALELLQQYGDLDSVLAHSADIAGKRPREALLQYGELARLSRELVTIQRDVPVTLDLDAVHVRPPDREHLAQLFAELEFRTLIPKLDDLGAGLTGGNGAAGGRGPRPPSRAVPQPAQDPVILNAPADVEAMVAELRRASLVALDTETSAPDPLRGHLVGMSLAMGAQRSWYLPFGHVAPEGVLAGSEPPANLPPLDNDLLAPLRALLEDPSVPKAGHDLKQDWLTLRRTGIELAGAAHDSMLASFVLDPGRRSHTLEELAHDRLGLTLQNHALLLGKGKAQREFDALPVPEAARYTCANTETVLLLVESFRPELEDHKLLPLLETIELPLLRVLVGMQWHGVLVDRARLAEISRTLAVELSQLERDIYAAAGTDFNLNSTPQLRTILFDKLELPLLKKTKTGASTDSEVLERLAAMGHEVPRLLLEYRELSKLKSTYVDALPTYINPETGRIHGNFNQTGAATGRLSSSEPNLQNIPVRTRRGEAIRRAFIAPAGSVLLTADYSQIELRLLAHFSGDPAFVNAFGAGDDIHRQTAALIFGVPQDQVTSDMRGRAKTINFATIYGQGPVALSHQLGITLEEAKEFIKAYFMRFSGVRAWLDRTIASAREKGYVETLFGRRRYIPELRDRNFNIRAFGERTATNSPLQGSAADLIKIAMTRIDRALREADSKGRLVLQVHDELVLEVPESEQLRTRALVKRHMETAAELRVPLVVSTGVGKDWVDAKG